MFTHLHLADIFVQSDLHQFIHRWQRLTRYVFTRFFFNSQISDSGLCWCVLIQFFFFFFNVTHGSVLLWHQTNVVLFFFFS